jgi:hypothetical protein
MHKCLKNTTAIKTLIRELTRDRPVDWEAIRLHCRSLVYACFLMEIEPYQLPLSNIYRGNLTESQKKIFLQEFLSLYLNDNGMQFKTISRMLENESRWSFVLNSIDETINIHKK